MHVATANMPSSASENAASILAVVSCSVQRIHLEFELLLTSTDHPGVEQSIASIITNDANNDSNGFEIFLEPFGPQLEGAVATDPDAGGSDGGDLTSPTVVDLPPLTAMPDAGTNGWKHVAFDVVLSDDSTGAVAVTIDGAVTMVNARTRGFGCAEILIEVGTDTEAAGTSVFAANYDNVAIDLEQ